MFWSRCFVQKFSFIDIFNNINDGYRAAILKKYLWLLPFFIVVVTHCQYENVSPLLTAVLYYLLQLATCWVVLFSLKKAISKLQKVRIFFLLFWKTSLSSLCLVCSDFIFINFKTYNHFYLASGTLSFVRDELYIDFRKQAS